MLAILDGAHNHFVLTPNSLVGYFGLISRFQLRIAVALGVALLCLTRERLKVELAQRAESG
jgi:hypothetical protein